LAWTPLPLKPENGIITLANGACNGLPIDHVSGSALKMPGFEGFSKIQVNSVFMCFPQSLYDPPERQVPDNYVEQAGWGGE